MDHCRYSKLLADNEMSDTYNFREAMQVVRERARNDIKAQQDVTDFTLRKRIYQTQKARNELDWQKMKVSVDKIQSMLSKDSNQRVWNSFYRCRKKWT